jgi:hypothetical protein
MEHFNSVQTLINYGRKKFCNIDPRLDDKISLYHINATLFEQSDPKVMENLIWELTPLPGIGLIKYTKYTKNTTYTKTSKQSGGL